MTDEDLLVVRAVLSARLSYKEAEDLTLEISRRCAQGPRQLATCQVEHSHWEGPMICGNRLPCAKHGGR